MMLEFGMRTRPPSRPWRIVVVKEMSCTLQSPVDGISPTTIHSSSWTGRLIVMRTPARTFWMIWLDETATTIPRMPSDATTALRSKARRYRALA
ncbi:hypothetical protein DSECCO2_441140 [anaerobic digester metagenome]